MDNKNNTFTRIAQDSNEQLKKVSRSLGVTPQNTSKLKHLVDTIEASVNDAEFDKMLQKDPVLRAKMQELQKMPRGTEQCLAVEKFWNSKITWTKDEDNYGILDYMAKPSETWKKKKGDCEDFSVAKYAMLRKLGYDKDDLQILFVRQSQVTDKDDPNMFHAVLSVNTDNQRIILDNTNLNGDLLQANKILMSDNFYKRSYIPLAGLNEEAAKEYNLVDSNNKPKPFTRQPFAGKDSPKSEAEKLNEVDRGIIALALKERISNPNKILTQTYDEISADSWTFGEMFVPKEEREKFHTMPRDNEYYKMVEKYANKQINKTDQLIEKEKNPEMRAKLYERLQTRANKINEGAQFNTLNSDIAKAHMRGCKQVGPSVSNNQIWKKLPGNSRLSDLSVKGQCDKVNDQSLLKMSQEEKLYEVNKNYAIQAFGEKIMLSSGNDTFIDSLIFEQLAVPEKNRAEFDKAILSNNNQHSKFVSQYCQEQANKTDYILKNEKDVAVAGNITREQHTRVFDKHSMDQEMVKQLQDTKGYKNIALAHADCKHLKQELAAAAKTNHKEEKGMYMAMD